MAKTVFDKTGQSQDTSSLIVLGLEQIGRNIDKLLWQQALEHELSPLQIRILLLIHFSKKPAGVSSLAIEMNLSKATVSVALKPMEQKKLIQKRKSDTDSRNVDIALTEWGAQIAHVSSFYLEPLYKILVHIPSAEKEMMLKNISGILGKME
jgi:DNA-binding MarR family transcriptional regulator